MIAQSVAGQQMREIAAAVAVAPVRPTPNPRVGCRILDPAGNLIAEGIHGTDGPKHAEVIALEIAGDRARGGTVIVTLEPCAHVGRTGPCVAALIEAGVAEVWFSQSDATEAGGGAAQLRAAGVRVFGGIEASATIDLIEPWLKYTKTGRPYVTLKLAATLDGYIAAPDGSSRWITGELAREQVHRYRAQADAVLVGTGTALADNPQLNVRLAGDWPQPAVFVLGERHLPPDLHLAQSAVHLRHRDLNQALSEIAATGAQQVFVEGGATLAQSMLNEQLVDRLIWFVAPKLLGGGTPAIGGLGIERIQDALQWRMHGVHRYGDDLAIDLRPQRSAD